MANEGAATPHVSLFPGLPLPLPVTTTEPLRAEQPGEQSPATALPPHPTKYLPDND